MTNGFTKSQTVYYVDVDTHTGISVSPEKGKKLELTAESLTSVLNGETPNLAAKENEKLKEELDKFSEVYKRYRDYEKEELAESCYDLARENDELKEKLSAITMVSDDEKQSIEHILELEKENKELKDNVFFRDNRISWFEWEEERLNSVINTLKKKLENSVWFWKKKVAKLSEENRILKHRNEILDLSLKASVSPLVYNELVWNIEISKLNEWKNS